MAGIRRVIIPALSMAVTPGMVGADGLGEEVASSISTPDIAKGVEAGPAVVNVAIHLDPNHQGAKLTIAVPKGMTHINPIADLKGKAGGFSRSR